MAMSTGSKVFGLVVLSILGGVLFVLFTVGSDSDAEVGDPTGPPITVEVPEGASADAVADILVDRGVLERTLPFRLAVRGDPERAAQIQPGSYELRAGMGSEQILARLTEQESAPAFRATIPEGRTVGQTLEAIADAEDSPFNRDDLTAALAGVALPAWVPADLPADAEPFEGLLAPDTYEWRQDIEPQAMLGELVAATEQRLAGLDVAEADRYSTLITASLIEREVKVPDEQPTVSSVIANRLADDQALQIDASVIYASVLDGGDPVVDTDLDSPWNTYANTGLPPTPIAAPGSSALAAAADPAETDLRFYVVCDVGSGAHAFTQTLDQHNRNVARYREIRDAGSGSYCDEAA